MATKFAQDQITLLAKKGREKIYKELERIVKEEEKLKKEDEFVKNKKIYEV